MRAALENDFTVDITTFGRRTGRPRRLEIWMLHIDGRFFITGTPRARDWLANLRADPRVVVHVKQAVHDDVGGRVVEVTDAGTRRWVFEHDDAAWYLGQTSLDDLVTNAPMVEIFFDDAPD